ncbi:MAG TPA: hypothetical protein VI306_05500 [Pyrinomonadaceae bacterium]
MISLVENQAVQAELITDKEKLRQQVESVVLKTPAIDIHTHVHPPVFSTLFLSGIDDLLTYHYLIAETLRASDLSHACFWRMTKTERADFVWKTLFVDSTPLSEAARGIVTILKAFDLDTRAENLNEARTFFAAQRADEHLDRVLEMAAVSDVVMTNDPFSEQETQLWLSEITLDARFHASLRLDGLLNDWPNAFELLSAQEFKVNRTLDETTFVEIRRFIDKWILKMRPVYMAVSLPADFRYPVNDDRTQLLREVIMPTAREHNLSLAVMIGVRRGVNPNLRSAGDGVGKADMTALERMCGEFADVKFLATFLSRENQHELCVSARKFNNLMPFGCWWFLNNPSIVSEITAERLELLGPTFVPQHSDARVLEQLIYKWQHSRTQIANSLNDAYARLLDSGRPVSAKEISRDVTRLFSGNFRNWVGQDLL